MELPVETKRVDVVRFHPTASQVLSCVCHETLHVLDANVAQPKCSITLDDEVHFVAMDWHINGKLLATASKDMNIRILDPRTNESCAVFQGFTGCKEPRVLWLGDGDYVVGAGTRTGRGRAITVWDVRNSGEPVTEVEVGTGIGTLMPFLDLDTNLIVVAGKGDPSLKLFEFNSSTKELSFSSQQQLSQQTFGCGMTPKRVLDVMNGEVNRLYQLSKNMITPLPYIIPRKSYRDFQPDLFPDTLYSGTSALNAELWFAGEDRDAVRLSLDPNKKKETVKPANAGLKPKGLDAAPAAPAPAPASDSSPAPPILTEKPVSTPIVASPVKPVPDANPVVYEGVTDDAEEKKSTNLKTKGSGNFTSKFRHLVGEPMHKKCNIENIKNLCESLPSESDGVQANDDLIALALSGSGGQISICQLSKPGRLPECDIPTIVNGCNILDFAMDPFDSRNIAVACEDWHIRLWEVPADGLTTTLDQPKHILKGHENRVSIVKYHPTASNILVSAAFDHTVRVWDLTDVSEIGALEGHTDQILCLGWHPDGKKLATVCRDKKIRIYEPLDDLAPQMEEEGPEIVRGGRILWCGPDNNWLLVSSSFGSRRGLFLYDSSDGLKLLASEDEIVGNSPAVLHLHYDESTALLFAYGKGERSMFVFEVNETAPYLHNVTEVRFNDLQQGVVFLRKNVVDVRKVEFLRAIRVTKTYIEVVSFTVPRIKMEYFQDDVFPDVRLTWEPALTAGEWLDDSNATQVYVSLKPSDMMKLSDAPKEAPKAMKYSSQAILTEKTDAEKKKELINAMMNKLDIDEKLEQDNFEGVDEDEWDD